MSPRIHPGPYGEGMSKAMKAAAQELFPYSSELFRLNPKKYLAALDIRRLGDALVGDHHDVLSGLQRVVDALDHVGDGGQIVDSSAARVDADLVYELKRRNH